LCQFFSGTNSLLYEKAIQSNITPTTAVLHYGQRVELGLTLNCGITSTFVPALPQIIFKGCFGTGGDKRGDKFLATLTAYSHLNASMPLDLRTER
jgi:hypothetical protein